MTTAKPVKVLTKKRIANLKNLTLGVFLGILLILTLSMIALFFSQQAIINDLRNVEAEQKETRARILGVGETRNEVEENHRNICELIRLNKDAKTPLIIPPALIESCVPATENPTYTDEEKGEAERPESSGERERN